MDNKKYNKVHITEIPMMIACVFMPYAAIVYAGIKANNNRWILLGFSFMASLFIALDFEPKPTEKKSKSDGFYSLYGMLAIGQIASAFVIRQKYMQQLGKTQQLGKKKNMIEQSAHLNKSKLIHKNNTKNIAKKSAKFNKTNAINKTNKYEIKDIFKVIKVNEDKVILESISTFGKVKHTKTIPISSICALEFKNAGIIVNGYIHFVLSGSQQIKNSNGYIDLINHENSFPFSRQTGSEVVAMKEYLEEKITNRSNKVTIAPEKTVQALLNLRELYEKDIITAEEYEQKRQELLIKL